MRGKGKKSVLIGWCSVGMVSMAGAAAFGQPAFSIDGQGPTVTGGVVGSAPGNGPIAADDILFPPFPGFVPAPGPLPPPAVMITGGPPPGPFGTLGLAVRGELDALSGGQDHFGKEWFFSVDEFAIGAPGVPFPSVTTEGAAGVMEASADIFTTAGPPAGFNLDIIDGDGLAPFGGPGLGLIEPNPPGMGVPDPGDNLDALDMEGVPAFGVFFSLDSAFADPLEVAIAPPNTGTAAANGFVGGDVLFSVGAGPVLYAGAAALGLDAAGADTDDLDALVLFEDGDMIYTPADFLAFSVRRGSAVIGALDSLLGLPIEEGDILVPGLPGAAPGILVTAEALGLATLRSGTAVGFGDELDALDVVPEPATLSLLALGGVAMLRRRRR